MTTPTDAGRSRARRLILPAAIGAGVLLVVAVVLILVLPGKSAPTAMPGSVVVKGTVTLVKGQYVFQDPRPMTTCWGEFGFNDIAAGAQVVVTDAGGKTVGVGALDQPRMSNGDPTSPTAICTATFSVSVPAGDFYGVKVGSRNVVQVPRAQAGDVRLQFNP